VADPRPTNPIRRTCDRPVVKLVVQPEPGVDGTRAVRRLLKFALRTCGLRCISAEEEVAS
jgi:hypothetical protein